MKSFGLATCKEGWLHRFNIQKQNSEWVEEICEICGKRVVHVIYDGQVDNNKYAAYNIRLFLQPNHPQFIREYGK